MVLLNERLILIPCLGENNPFIRNVFTLKSCADIPGAEVKTFNDEKDLLEAWSEFVGTLDPDLVIGFNIFDFDIRYLIGRAKHIGAGEFLSLGRLSGNCTYFTQAPMTNNLIGPSTAYQAKHYLMCSTWQGAGQPWFNVRYPTLEGRLQLDLLPFFRREFSLQKKTGSAHGPYSLAGVSDYFLGGSKEDVHFTQITDLFNGDEFDRQKLAVYCLKVCLLPICACLVR